MRITIATCLFMYFKGWLSLNLINLGMTFSPLPKDKMYENLTKVYAVDIPLLIILLLYLHVGAHVSLLGMALFKENGMIVSALSL